MCLFESTSCVTDPHHHRLLSDTIASDTLQKPMRLSWIACWVNKKSLFDCYSLSVLFSWFNFITLSEKLGSWRGGGKKKEEKTQDPPATCILQIGVDPGSETCHLIQYCPALLTKPSPHSITNIARAKTYGLYIQAWNMPADQPAY